MANIEIREAKESDRQIIIDAMVNALSPFYGGDHVAHADRIFSTHLTGGQDKIGFFSFEQKMFVCTVDGDPGGFIHLVGKRQETYKISPLIVLPDFRGKYKLGSLLLEYAEKYAMDKQAKQLYCTVAEVNKSALSFFKKNGFVEAGTSDSHYKEGISEKMLYKNFDYIDFSNKFDRLHISVIPFEESYEDQVRSFLLAELPKSFKGIDGDWVDSLISGYRRRFSNDINLKYKLIYLAVDSTGAVLGVAAGTPKKGKPIKLMPLVTKSIPAFIALVNDIPYLLGNLGRKLYVHITPSIEETIALQLGGWILDAVLPGAYHDEKVTQQWSLSLKKAVRSIRMKKQFLNYIKEGTKTVEVRVNYDYMNDIQLGEEVILFAHDQKELIRIKNIRRYNDFEELLATEPYHKIHPEAESQDDVLQLLRDIYPKSRENLGVIALEIEYVSGKEAYLIEEGENVYSSQTLRKWQNAIGDFDEKRDWDGFYPLEILLNLSEEAGEIWQRIAWVDEEKKKSLVEKYRLEMQSDIGDLLQLVLKLANQFDVDAEQGLMSVMYEYQKRFPVEETKGKTANKDLGIDKKDY